MKKTFWDQRWKDQKSEGTRSIYTFYFVVCWAGPNSTCSVNILPAWSEVWGTVCLISGLTSTYKFTGPWFSYQIPPNPSMTALAFKDGPFSGLLITTSCLARGQGNISVHGNYAQERTQHPEWEWGGELQPGSNGPGSLGLCDVWLYFIILCLYKQPWEAW